MKRVTLIVHDRFGCPFHVGADYESVGPPGPVETCGHPKRGKLWLCPTDKDGYGTEARGYPVGCPLRDGDELEHPPRHPPKPPTSPRRRRETYTHCPEHGCELRRGRCAACDSPLDEDDLQ